MTTSSQTDLRIPGKGRGNPVTITFNGRPVAAFEGETVHAALSAAGIRKFRADSDGHGHGVFCGMGVCYECVVTVDGVENQRACSTFVKDGMAVTFSTGPENPDPSKEMRS